MNRSDFETVVRYTIAGLPDWARDALDNIEVLVLEKADDHLDADGETLLGLYVGVPLTERGTDYAGELPDVIYIFRHPHLALGLSPDALSDEISRTLIHEIAHYFGIDDERLDEIGWG